VRRGNVYLSMQILDYWGPSKKLLSDMNFLKDLKDYDKDSIHVSNPSFSQFLTLLCRDLSSNIRGSIV